MFLGVFVFLMLRRPRVSTRTYPRFPYTTLALSSRADDRRRSADGADRRQSPTECRGRHGPIPAPRGRSAEAPPNETRYSRPFLLWRAQATGRYADLGDIGHAGAGAALCEAEGAVPGPKGVGVGKRGGGQLE